MKNNYFTVLPANVRYDKELSPQAKLLFSELTILCDKEGFCWATNAYFADLYGVDKITVSRWISQLKKRGYIFFEDVNKNDNTLNNIVIKYRRICIATLNKNVKQNIKELNNKNKGARGRARDESHIAAYNLELFEKMLNEEI